MDTDSPTTDPLYPYVTQFATQLVEVEEVLFTALHAYETAHPGIHPLVYKMALEALIQVLDHQIQARTEPHTHPS